MSKTCLDHSSSIITYERLNILGFCHFLICAADKIINQDWSKHKQTTCNHREIVYFLKTPACLSSKNQTFFAVSRNESRNKNHYFIFLFPNKQIKKSITLHILKMARQEFIICCHGFEAIRKKKLFDDNLPEWNVEKGNVKNEEWMRRNVVL